MASWKRDNNVTAHFGDDNLIEIMVRSALLLLRLMPHPFQRPQNTIYNALDYNTVNSLSNQPE